MKPRLTVTGRGRLSADKLTHSLTQALRGGHTYPNKNTRKKIYFQKCPQKYQKLPDLLPNPSQTAKNAPTFSRKSIHSTYQKLLSLLASTLSTQAGGAAKPAPSAQKRPQQVSGRVEVSGRVSDMCFLLLPALLGLAQGVAA